MDDESGQLSGPTQQIADTTRKPAASTADRPKFVGEILVDAGLVSREQLDEAISVQRRRLGQVLVEMGACTEAEIESALRLQRLGRTRLHRYARYLKLAVAATVLTVASLVVVFVRLEREKAFALRLQREELSTEEVRKVLQNEAPNSKLEALRSMRHRLNDPKVIQLLSHVLRNEHWYLRLYAIVLARTAKNPALLPDLLELVEGDPEILAPVAHDAIREIARAQRQPRASNDRGS